VIPYGGGDRDVTLRFVPVKIGLQCIPSYTPILPTRIYLFVNTFEVCPVCLDGLTAVLRNHDTMMNLERITVIVDNSKGGTRAGRRRRQQQAPPPAAVPLTTQSPSATTHAPQRPEGLGKNVCGYISRFNDAIFRPTLHVQCARPLLGRYVYVEATGVTGRNTRLFNAVLCEVMVYS